MGIDINWGAAPAPFDPVGANIAGQTAGLDLGQRKATIHALQGIDLNNPQSVDAGIGNLVHANAMEQGNALQNLSFTRSLRSQIPGLLSSLAGENATSQPKADEAVSGDPQHAIETFTLAKKAADTLANTPEEDRPAAFDAIRKDMLARGIPAEALDSAGQHLAGDGPQQLSQYYGGLLAHATHQMDPQGEPPAMPAAHPSSAWYNNVVENPKVPLAVAMMKGAGLDLTPYLDTAKSLAMPGIQKQADIAAAPQLAAVDIAKAIATAKGTAPVDVAKAVGIEAGTNPYKAALAQATADIAAHHDVLTVPEVDPKTGEPTGRSVVYRKDAALNSGAGGKPIGVAQSPSETAGKTADANVFMNKYTAEANQDAIQSDINARDQSLAAAHMAQSLNPSNLTPWLAKNANTLNGLGVKIASADANKLSTYQTLVAQNLKSAIQVFPRNMGEFHAISDAAANAKSPGDAAALALTETAAIRDMQAAQKQFRVKWAAENPGKYSEREFQTAWAGQPGANQSVFASPLFRDLKFNGKPAVTVYPAYTDGHVYGVFMPGTPQKTTFRVR